MVPRTGHSPGLAKVPGQNAREVTGQVSALLGLKGGLGEGPGRDSVGSCVLDLQLAHTVGQMGPCREPGSSCG